MNVPNYNQRFLDREPTLAEIRGMLSANDPWHHKVILRGMAGIGKTQIAAHYAHHYRSEYRAVFWIHTADDSEDKTTYYQSFLKFAVSTGCVMVDDTSSSDVVTWVISWLEQRTPWLLVVDNLYNVHQFRDMGLPAAGIDRHILITTRNPFLRDGLAIPFLKEEQARQLLQAECQDDFKTTPDQQGLVIREADHIVKELGYLPLAIAQAAAYIREESLDIFTFLTDYKNHKKKLLERLPQDTWEYCESVGTTLLMSFSKVKKNSPLAAKLLNMFSFLQAAGISVELLQAGRKGLDKGLSKVFNPADAVVLNEALFELSRYSLIDRTRDGIVVHRLVQAILRENMSRMDSMQYMKMAVAIFEAAFPTEINNETREICRRYQGQIVVPLLQQIDLISESTVLVASRVGEFLRLDGLFKDSASLLEKAVETLKQASSNDSKRRILRLKCSLAKTYMLQGRVVSMTGQPGALGLQKEVLEAQTQLLGKEDPDTLDSIHNLAVIHWKCGSVETALKLLSDASEIRAKVLGPEDPATLESEGLLATLYDHSGIIRNICLHKKVYCIRKKLFGPEDRRTLAAMDNLAVRHAFDGQTQNALKLNLETFTVLERIMGRKHPDTLSNMHNLGHLYALNGMTAKAVELYREVVSGRKEVLGNEHIDTLASLHNYAITYYTLEKETSHIGKPWNPPEAIDPVEMLKITAQSFRDVLGHEHRNTLSSVIALAFIYNETGKTKLASELKNEVKATFEWNEEHELHHRLLLGRMALGTLPMMGDVRGWK